jgi:hypothetical protein
MEMDYGTPFDRHTIIDDSTETKKKKQRQQAPKLEESMSVGFGGLLRRLSKRDRDAHSGHISQLRHHPGVYMNRLHLLARIWKSLLHK